MTPLDPLSDDDELSRLTQRALRELPEPPQGLQQRVLALFPARPGLASLGAAAGALAAGALRHVLAVLSFDSWAAPTQALGMRSLRDPTRHLLFSAQGRDIDLRILPGSQGAGFALAGQILGPDEAGQVELRPHGGAAPVHAALDAMGEFRLEGLPAGACTLTLALGGDLIELPTLQLGDPGA